MINDAKADDPTDPLALDGKARGATPAIPHRASLGDPSPRVCILSQIVICAINTLGAMHRHQPINSLFESLCYPSSSERAKEIYTK